MTKKCFEKFLGRKISMATWYRILADMKSFNLPPSKDNLSVVAILKNYGKLHRIPLDTLIAYYTIKSAYITHPCLGRDLHERLELMTSAHRTTISRWFDGDYSPEKLYSPSEISKIILSACLYNLRKVNNDSQQKSNRVSTLSTKEK